MSVSSKKFHRVTGIILLLLTGAMTVIMTFYSVGAVVMYTMTLSMLGCSAFTPIVVSPVMCLGMGIGSLIVLFSPWKKIGYGIFFVSLALIPMILPKFVSPMVIDLCNSYFHVLDSLPVPR